MSQNVHNVIDLIVMRKILLFAVLLILCLNSSAQSNMGAFWGLELGQNKSQVESVLKTKGLTYKWKEVTEKGEIPCQIKGPSIGGIKFHYLTLYFKAGVLTKGMFHSYDGCGCSLEDWRMHEAGFNSSAMNFQKTFSKVKGICLLKYGSPIVDTDTIAEWQEGTCRISVEYEYELKREPYMISSWTRVMLTYENVDFSEF